MTPRVMLLACLAAGLAMPVAGRAQTSPPVTAPGNVPPVPARPPAPTQTPPEVVQPPPVANNGTVRQPPAVDPGIVKPVPMPESRTTRTLPSQPPPGGNPDVIPKATNPNQ